MLSASFLDFINKEKLFDRDEHLLLAISGGLDSVVLADLLKENGFNFSLAHMNFQLRGSDSDEDEKFVQSIAKELQVKLFVKRVDVDLERGSIQMQARDLRYQWFEELMLEHKFDKLLTAHHGNDLLETVLLNLSRGTGIKGVRGILPLQKSIARPLLFASKAQLEEYAQEKLIKWREDSSNATVHYTRNHIRHNVIPQLLSINPNLVANFQQTALRLRANEVAWEEKMMKVTKEYVSNSASLIKISKTILQDPFYEVYLAEVLSDYGFSLQQIQSVDFTRVGSQLFSSHYVLNVDRDFFFLEELIEESSLEVFPIEINVKDKEIKTPFGLLEINEIDRSEIAFSSDENMAYIDIESLNNSLCIDLWHEGDKVQPLGMQGKKKISDILIDRKVPKSQKSKVLVLKSADDIVWLIGHNLSDSNKIRNSSKKILQLIYHENS